MSNQITPARGMRDFLPQEKAKREYVISIIRGVYQSFGYTEIETPALENIERLTSSEGGENLSMLFKVLRRGLNPDEKLDITDAADLGLRYDLTLPLARYYASNAGQLPTIFRATQIAPVWRAERPQKGRFRQFTQCDIDIVGVADERAEIELICVTSLALQALGITNSTVRLNDRRLLISLLSACGYPGETHSSILIIIDKIDKIGLAEIQNELTERLPDFAAANNVLISSLQGINNVAKESKSDIESILKELPAGIDNDALVSLRKILSEVAHALPSVSIRFDPTLVRGMGYYTGPIFEVEIPGSTSSVAGGGRYDGMIGKFFGKPVPACGFSLGFERLVDLVDENILPIRKKIVVFYDSSETTMNVFAAQRDLIQRGYDVTTLARPKHLGKAVTAAKLQGFTHFANLEVGQPLIEESHIKAMQ